MTARRMMTQCNVLLLAAHATQIGHENQTVLGAIWD